MLNNALESKILSYGLNEPILKELYYQVINFITNNLKIKIQNGLPDQGERYNRKADMYYIFRGEAIDEGKEQIMTCCIYSEDLLCIPKFDDFGGLAMRLFDLIHIGCGHFCQWKSDKSNTEVKFKGKRAWEIGKSAYKTKKSDKELKLIKEYEEEAGIICIKKLNEILYNNNYDELLKKKITNFFKDFIDADLDAHLSYCRDNTHTNIFKYWEAKLTNV